MLSNITIGEVEQRYDRRSGTVREAEQVFRVYSLKGS